MNRMARMRGHLMAPQPCNVAQQQLERCGLISPHFTHCPPRVAVVASCGARAPWGGARWGSVRLSNPHRNLLGPRRRSVLCSTCNSQHSTPGYILWESMKNNQEFCIVVYLSGIQDELLQSGARCREFFSSFWANSI